MSTTEEKLTMLELQVQDLMSRQSESEDSSLRSEWEQRNIDFRLEQIELGDDGMFAAGENPDAERLHFDQTLRFPYSNDYPFGLKLSGTTATIYPGYLIGTTKRTHFASSQTDVALTGTGTSYIYAYISKVNPTTLTIHNANVASWPESNDDNYVFPLYIISSDDAATYLLTEPVLGGQSIVIGAPVGW